VNVAPPYGKHAPAQNIAVAVALATQVGGILIRQVKMPVQEVADDPFFIFV
jgi:hypothetical protein